MTQSFHGTLFSALFNRNFWSYDCEGQHNPEDDRAIAILDQLGLKERYQMVDDLLKLDIMEKIDYEPVNKRIEEFRKISFEYIDSFMGC